MFQLDASGAGDTPTPFSFTPQRLHLNKDHEYFENLLLQDGDIHRHIYLQNLSGSETDEKPKLSVSEFGCHTSGCFQVFGSLEEYEHHYNSLHRHVCCTCRRSLPSARLLDIHIQEWHDSLFTILCQRQDMYQCLVEGCGQKFRMGKQRKDHLITIHKYPPDFRFDKAKRDRGTSEMKIQKKKEPGGEVMEGVCECASVCEDVPEQPEEDEAMELHVSPEPGTRTERNPEVSAADNGTAGSEQRKPHYSYRVPASVCFGQGSVRGFRGRGRRK